MKRHTSTTNRLRRVFHLGMLIFVVLIAVSHVKGDLASDVRAVSLRLQKLEEIQSAQSTYCKLFARGKCGKCLCRVDFTIPKKFYCDCRTQPPRRDCREFRDNGYRNINGLYLVTMNGFKKTEVYCDQTADGGGWTVIQRRFNGAENFYRGWEAYKRGFGELQREFWLGNDNIHLLTAQAIYPRGSEARVMVSYNNGVSLHGYTYPYFRVNNERNKYSLQITSASPSSSYPFVSSDKQKFSTYDRDNDGAPSYNCAKDVLYAGWWINGSGNTCSSTKTNLNGPYDAYADRSASKRINYNGHPATLNGYEIRVRRL